MRVNGVKVKVFSFFLPHSGITKVVCFSYPLIGKQVDNLSKLVEFRKIMTKLKFFLVQIYSLHGISNPASVTICGVLNNKDNILRVYLFRRVSESTGQS